MSSSFYSLEEQPLTVIANVGSCLNMQNLFLKYVPFTLHKYCTVLQLTPVMRIHIVVNPSELIPSSLEALNIKVRLLRSVHKKVKYVDLYSASSQSASDALLLPVS